MYSSLGSNVFVGIHFTMTSVTGIRFGSGCFAKCVNIEPRTEGSHLAILGLYALDRMVGIEFQCQWVGMRVCPQERVRR
jgi:hypothetical protein